MNNLPVELVSKILLHLPVNPSDRLVCQAFNTILTPRTFRTFRTWDFTKDEFDRLVAISQSPLAKHVHEYQYKLTPFVPLRNFPPSRSFQSLSMLITPPPTAEIHEVDSMVALTTPCHAISVDTVAASIVTQHETLLHQVDILGTYYDILSLTKALPSFRNLKAVTISRFDETDTAPMAFETATTRAWWGVIKALNKCQYPVEKLAVDSVYASMLVRVPLAKMVQALEIVRDLRELKFPYVSVCPEMEHGVANEIMLQVLRTARNLESLELGNGASGFVFGMWLVNRRYSETFWPNLRKLHLSARCNVRAEDLISFLADHRQSLRELTLSHFGLSRYASDMKPMVWDSLFRVLGETLTLEKLILNHLWGPTGTPGISDDDLRRWEQNLSRRSVAEIS